MGLKHEGNAGQATNDVYDDGYLRVEHGYYYVACGGERLVVTRKEFLIISCLARNAGQWVTREDLWGNTWGRRVPFGSGALRVNVHHTRRKLERFGVHLENDPGKGYRLSGRGPSPHLREGNQAPGS
jgi:two-component system KDP operon response regulator KdpE